jgi:hypothetical protein
MLFRLPGKRTLAIGLFIASAALALGFVAVGVPVEFLARILALWAVPFLAIRYVQALPRWTGFAIAWTFALAVCYGLVRVTQWIPPESLPERLPHLLLVALMFIPWCVALIVSWTKSPFQDAVRILAYPIPFCALAASAVFFWGIRVGVREEQVAREFLLSSGFVPKDAPDTPKFMAIQNQIRSMLSH